MARRELGIEPKLRRASKAIQQADQRPSNVRLRRRDTRRKPRTHQEGHGLVYLPDVCQLRLILRIRCERVLTYRRKEGEGAVAVQAANRERKKDKEPLLSVRPTAHSQGNP